MYIIFFVTLQIYLYFKLKHISKFKKEIIFSTQHTRDIILFHNDI